MIIEINGKSFNLGKNVRKSMIGALDILSGYAAYKMVTSTFDMLGMFSGNGVNKTVIKIGKHIMASVFALETCEIVNHTSNHLMSGLVKGVNRKINKMESNDGDHWQIPDVEDVET